MKLIVGLGNPGTKYAKTRHNLGFLAIDSLANSQQTTDYSKRKKKLLWKINRKFLSAVCSLPSAIIVKPQTFVNQAGVAVKRIVDFYKLVPQKVLVIRDDIDLPKGKIRGPKNLTGSGGHLGIESIKQHLSSGEFYQLKIGIGRPSVGIDPSNWVLTKMSDDELANFTNLIKNKVVNKVRDWINE